MQEIYADIDQKQALYRFKNTYKDRFMLRFDHADGNVTCIEYNHLARTAFREDTVILNYIHTTIQITGQNLQDLALAIGYREAGRIVEQHVSSSGIAVGEVFIEKVEVLER